MDIEDTIGGEIPPLKVSSTKEIKSMNEEFVTAAREGNYSLIQQFLLDEKRKIDVNFKEEEYGRSAISEASLNGHEEIVKLLISYNCDVNAKDSFDATPLFLTSSVEVARLLLAAGADPDHSGDYDGNTPITIAFQNDHSEVVSLLINEPSKSKSKTKFVNSMSHAVKYGDDYLVKQLLEAGAIVDVATDVKVAVSQKHYSTVVLMLSFGKIVNRSALNDLSAYEPIFLNNLSPMKKNHIDSAEPQTLLMKCAEDGASEAVTSLILAGADVEIKNSNDMTALMIASERGHEATVSSLLQNGAKWNEIKNKNGDTAHVLALKNKHPEVANLLWLFHRGYFPGKEKDYKSSLIKAASRADIGLCAKILDIGVSVDATNEHGQTGLQSASEAGHLSTVSFFLENGAEPSLVSKVGLSAMQYSLKFGHYQIAAILINAKSKTPHHLECAGSRMNDFFDYLNHDSFDKVAFGNSDDQLYEKLQVETDFTAHEESEEAITDHEDFTNEDKVEDERKPSIIETLIKFGSEKNRKKCLEVLVLAEEKKHGEDPPKNEKRVIENLRNVFHHPELAFAVQYVKTLFPMGTITFLLTSCFLFITQIIVGFSSYCLDISTDIHFTESLFAKSLRNDTIHGPNSNLNQTIFAVHQENEFLFASIISGVHVGLSFIISILIFVGMECGQFSRKSLCRIPIPFVSKSYGFYLEYQKLKQSKRRRGNARDIEIRKWSKKIQSHSDWINLSLMLEASFESVFQFLFQSIFVFPTTLGLIKKAEGIDDFLTVPNFSILTSFLSFAAANVTIRYSTV